MPYSSFFYQVFTDFHNLAENELFLGKYKLAYSHGPCLRPSYFKRNPFFGVLKFLHAANSDPLVHKFLCPLLECILKRKTWLRSQSFLEENEPTLRFYFGCAILRGQHFKGWPLRSARLNRHILPIGKRQWCWCPCRKRFDQLYLSHLAIRLSSSFVVCLRSIIAQEPISISSLSLYL